eukprot:CAMPEP_0117442832 /NCGR_PEP_ID=MMETSP0759-20121206/4365_1 /TAXON_ID=63605 /ORGANISM="Percolomonas cosmopolitus, Strain WS" /LENGTH=302 /DNA_ID=CAMNT_0005234753 /DNA_START=13 /DNA_END=922 /DNA_ORIENTATION=-
MSSKNAPLKLNLTKEQFLQSQLLKNGLKINYMNMSSEGKILWQSNWSKITTFDHKELQIKVPKEILECKVVSREVNFSSKEQMDNFRLLQRVLFGPNEDCIEEWYFRFGFVIPNSTNTLQNTIEAAEGSNAGQAGTLPPEVLSGNVVIETSFFDGDLFLGRNRVRVFYDDSSGDDSTWCVEPASIMELLWTCGWLKLVGGIFAPLPEKWSWDNTNNLFLPESVKKEQLLKIFQDAWNTLQGIMTPLFHPPAKDALCLALHSPSAASKFQYLTACVFRQMTGMKSVRVQVSFHDAELVTLPNS